ncbi:MAG: c-type cytochrome [Terriglobales bacterium]
MNRNRRELAWWAAVALGAIGLLLVILTWSHPTTQNRGAIVVSAKPAEGGAVFRDKGCARCHGERAGGGELGPRLRQRTSLASLPRLVTAMWNHAPRMYETMQKAKLPYPTLSYDETGQLVAWLYITGYSDEPGDPDRGRELFTAKRCIRCHSTDGSGTRAPDVHKLASADSPLLWTQALWNHGAEMESEMRREGIAWPRFQANELRDLFAYVRQAGGRTQTDMAVPAADADRGWQVFQAKSCLHCHALKNSAATTAQTEALVPSASAERPVAPVLESKLPPTFSQFGEAMLNHFPDMHRAMKSEGDAPPTFQAQEMADLAVFLYSLRYQEPSGSPQVGASIFTWRGCAECHGARGDGGKRGPALRGRGQTYTAVRLATDLWRHGAGMYQETRKQGQEWPLLQETDVGDLLTFLNTPVERK